MSDAKDISKRGVARIGLDPEMDFGFVGLGVELPIIYRMQLDPEWLYDSPVDELVSGLEMNPHITIIYGLLFSAEANRELVDDALSSWHVPNLVVMPGVEAFHSDDDYQAYSAIVLTLDTNTWDLESLKKGNDELRKLPHVNFFPEYKPHITVGYVKREFAEKAVARMKGVEVRPLHTRGLEYS